MNNKILFTGFVSAMVLFLALAAWADGNETDDINDTADNDTKTYNQTAAFESVYGAQVRLLQLEKAVTKNILWGDAIIEHIKARNSSANTTAAEAILAELKALREEISGIQPVAGPEGAKQFVELKHDAKELTKEFREEVRALLKASDIHGLKKALGARYNNNTLELEKRINQTRNRYNAERIEELLAAANITDPGLLERVRSGNMTAKEAKEALKQAYNALKAEKRVNAYLAIREKTVKRNVFMISLAEKVSSSRINSTQARMEKRLRLAERLNVSEDVKQRLRESTRLMEQRMDRIRNASSARIEGINEKMERKTTRLEERIGEAGSGRQGNGKGRGG